MAQFTAITAEAGKGLRLPLGQAHVVRVIPVAPLHTMARIRGALFDKDKAFLLPTCLEDLESFRKNLDKAAQSELLIVGHTDTTADKTVNDPLSKERAIATKQYLEDDVQGWLDHYGTKTLAKQRWGAREDRLMAIGIADSETRRRRKAGVKDPVVTFEGLSPVAWFQKHHNEAVDGGDNPRPKLKEDGKMGDKTREELVRTYMEQDGPSWIADKTRLKAITVHGAGENFPLDNTGLELDQRAVADRDGQRDRVDRRVELFFFDAAKGIVPPPGKPDGPEYLQWRKLAVDNIDVTAAGVQSKVTQVELEDVLFRTNSAVVLPEGETPEGTDSGQTDGENPPAARSAVTSIGAFAAILRFNEEHPGRTLLITGHTDTRGGEKDNQKLSEDRARMAHAVLTFDRETFKAIADKRHKVGDYKQILKWASVALTGLPQAPGDPVPANDFSECDPGKVDDVSDTGIAPLKAFQRAYNANKNALGVSGPDLDVDGSIGPDTWGAIFDCYQSELRNEMGENAAGMTQLRQGLVFLDPAKPTIGFGESHPIEGIGKDSFKSQANRRVEVLFFEPGEEPDLVLLEEAPEETELYLPDAYARIPIVPLVSAKPWFAAWVDTRAQIDKPARMAVKALGLPAGTPVSFEVFPAPAPGTGKSDEIKTFPGVAITDSATGQANDWDFEGHAVFKGLLEASGTFPQSLFHFAIVAGGRRVQTVKPIPYRDDLFLRPVIEGTPPTPMISKSYILITAWGHRKGVTSNQGIVTELNLAPGGADLLVNGTTLVSTNLIDLNWDHG